ncbi:hypothetical protein BD410DRAFT_785886 [Rickenella mellea]|uniref:Mid2 domain-containing protein n=1 Tax=Rickenella mellea TaxID=50990 RepID=A0A4Y7QAY6_9AGAM|nr:hypothetical protein BD410DRAFT_785886 [Rickenella mellea]
MSLPSPINFLPIAGVVPCKPYTFTFSYTETNEQHVKGGKNTLSAWLGDATTGTSMPTVGTGGAVYPGYWQLDWNPVRASAGEYFITAAVLSNSNATYTTKNQLFTIDAGSDESCINATATATLMSIVLEPGAGAATATPLPSLIPVTASSSTERTQLARAAKAGLAVGIIVIFFGLLAAILFVRRRRAARAQKARVPELPAYVPELPAYATVVPVGTLMAEKEKTDMDSKSELGPSLDYDRESLRSVPPVYIYHQGDV